MIKDKSYYCVSGWMINQLGLTGNDLICYAIIYSLSQSGEGRYIAGLSYLAEFMQCSQPTASKSVKYLFERGLIDKEEITTEFGRRVFYFCKDTDGDTKKSDGGAKESYGGVHKKFMDGSINNLCYNINKENKNNNSLTQRACAERNYLQEEYYKLMDDSSWKEVICMNYHLTMDELRKTLIEFFLDCKCAGTIQHQNEQDAKSHFNSWLKKNKNGNNSTNIRKQQKRGKTLDEFIEDSIAELHRSKPAV